MDEVNLPEIQMRRHSQREMMRKMMRNTGQHYRFLGL
jgi:hypothetical protein